MVGSVAAALPPLLSKVLTEGQSISPPLEVVGATVLNECSTLAEACLNYSCFETDRRSKGCLFLTRFTLKYDLDSQEPLETK